ncbi:MULTISPECIES: tetratricopeptide repeat protein [Giesbergeria]|uniref:Tetratricopeptide repeat protein n=1 Tax=Giesbergeria sinuosa TaxID=80883 RepID=A0ABV9QFL3_9BURK
MSLIHDALKSMDTPAVSTPVASRPATTAARPAWLGGVLAFVSVLGAGGVGWMLWQDQLSDNINIPPQAMVQSPPVAPLAVPATAEAPTTLTAPPVAVAPAPPAAQAPAPVRVAETAPPAAPAVVTAAVAKPMQASPRRAPAAVSATKDAAHSAPSVAETPVELLFARFVAAMKSGQQTDAEQALAALKQQLPAGAIGLVRAQAWFDLQAGRDTAAAEGYRTILDRMPGDEEAAINLASIQSRQHQSEEARATLDAAARLQPDSTALRAALSHFTPAIRHDR